MNNKTLAQVIGDAVVEWMSQHDIDSPPEEIKEELDQVIEAKIKECVGEISLL